MGAVGRTRPRRSGRWRETVDRVRRAAAPMADAELTVALGRTLVDDRAEEALAEDGYVVLDLLDADAVAELAAVRRRLHPSPGDGWETDFYHPDPLLKRDVRDAIGGAFAGPLEEQFVDHRTVLHNFIVNWPGDAGGLGLHQDPTFADHRIHRSTLVWCALSPATEANGNLHVVPRSHHLTTGAHPQQVPSWSEPHRDRLLRDHLRSVPVEPGQAIAFDVRLLHCSFPNQTSSPRETAAALVLPRAAQGWFLHAEGPEGPVRAYRLDPEFFIERQGEHGTYAEPADLELLATLEWEPIEVDVSSLASRLPPGTCGHVIA